MSYYLIDCHDEYNWEEATILETKTEQRQDCTVHLAHVAYRVYRTVGSKRKKKDDVGTYEGWNDEWDEWIPIHSP